MKLTVDASLSTPPARQLVERVLDAVAAGAWAAGDRLPSVRGMAAEVLINPNTVGKAYRELEHLGVVVGRAGSGMFVTEDGPARARALRRTETLDELRRVVANARACGLSAESIQAVVGEVLGQDRSVVVEPLEGE